MKDKLIPLRFNELLDFVRRDHSASLEPSTLILSSNSPTAVWRFISDYHQLSMLERGAQHSRFISTQDKSFVPIKFKVTYSDS